MEIPVLVKSETLRVTSVRPCTWAVAAMRAVEVPLKEVEATNFGPLLLLLLLLLRLPAPAAHAAAPAAAAWTAAPSCLKGP